MDFIIFFTSFITIAVIVIYYIFVIGMDKIQEAKTSTEVLLIALTPIFGLFIVSCKQRIEELENKSK